MRVEEKVENGSGFQQGKKTAKTINSFQQGN